MDNQKNKFEVLDIKYFNKKMLNWLQQFNIFCFTNNCGYSSPLGFKTLVACGVETSIELSNDCGFQKMQSYLESMPGWIFGHFNYEAGRKDTNNFDDNVGFPEGYFFSPKYLIQIYENTVEFLKCPDTPSDVFFEIENFTELPNVQKKSLNIKSKINKRDYLSSLEKIKKHIQFGDCYEINFCQEFFASGNISPAQLYLQLSELAPNPFSAFYKIEDKFCLCHSPERFIKRSGKQIISQPIKGTIARGINKDEDLKNFSELKNSEKNKSENVMIVDLVRNDFSKVCNAGSVKVDELFAIKSYPGVHQMVSTIKGELKDNISFSEIMEATFPMGSMTGAPKIKVMELISKYEKTKRGLYSGTIGYIEPNGDFDFNVVIRSLFYNSSNQYISFQAGGGITINSDAEDEYEEVLLKTSLLRKALIVD